VNSVSASPSVTVSQSVLLFADELAVALEVRHGQDALSHLVVGGGHAQAAGFGHHRLFVDQLLQDLLLEPQLLQQLLADGRSVGRPVRRHLALVRHAELQHTDPPAVHPRDFVARQGARRLGIPCAQEIGNVEDYEGDHHKAQAPLEPALVTPHAVEHRHGDCVSIKTKLLV
jgi:hypothetical protein